MNKKKLLVLHPALAPYRIDFFNSLNESFNASFYFFNKNLNNQKFDQLKLITALNFEPNYLFGGITYKSKTLRFGTIRAIRKIKPDMVMLPEFHPTVLLVILWRFLARKRYTIYTICDDSPDMVLKASDYKKKWKRFLINHLDGIILSNPDTVIHYKSWVSLKTKLLYFPIIQNDITFREKLLQTDHLLENYLDKYYLREKKVFLFVGRMVAVKNLQTLIKAFKTIALNEPDALLVLIGDGEEAYALKKLVLELGLQKQVIMPGRFEGLGLIAWYRLGSVFLLPSTFEPFGAVVNEALLSGCFCLVSNKAGSRILIEKGKNGLLFNPCDQKQLIKQMLECCSSEILWSHNHDLKPDLMQNNYNDSVKFIIDSLV